MFSSRLTSIRQRYYTSSTRHQHYVYRRSNSSQATGYRSLGLRREDKSRWERRTALTPAAVQQLIHETGTNVYVQPSTKRIYSDADYKKAGAIVTEDLSKADIILGIKEVPSSSLLNDKTYVFFSHTHKGNLGNMPMLQSILDKNIRLMDYELMKDEHGKRLVAFGEFAGKAGMIDMLHGMGHRFLGLGYSTPFMYLNMAHGYSSLASARLALGQVGSQIEDQGTPEKFGPLIYAFTGDGNVAHGAMDVFKELPHEFIPAEDLSKVVNDKNPRLNKVYATHLHPKDYLSEKNGKSLTSFEHYLQHPDQYHSEFHHKIAPYVNGVITGGYWDQRYPRILNNEQLKSIQLQQEKGIIPPGKMMALADIVCDVKGAFECLSHTTTIDDGFFYYDAINNKEHKDPEGKGIQIMGIDILPAELPVESSQHFSSKLYPYLKEMIHPGKTVDNWSSSIRDAIIAQDGELTSAHQDLKSPLASVKGVQHKDKKKVLLLGSGMVAGPLVNHLTKRSDVEMVVASNMIQEAQALVANKSNAQAVTLDISNQAQLSTMISKADVVVSFVPAFLHANVAKLCVEQRKHMVTASYVSPEMQALDQQAQQSDVLIMNEVGLDPGIDHMSAMKIIDDAKRQGKKIRSFISWCGGLPAPEASNVPLGYKFSWSPRGVLTASGNDALYWANGKKHSIAGEDLLKYHFPTIRTAYQGFVFEGLANRNSLGYADIYGLGDLNEMDTMFRGTLRYQGYSDLLYALKTLGFLDLKQSLTCTNWKQYFDQVLGNPDTIARKLGLNTGDVMLDKVNEALDFLTQKLDRIPFPSQQDKALDLFSSLLTHQLAYQPGEKDMVAMHHEFGIEAANGQKETITSTMIQYGQEHETAMAKTVGLPAAMVTELVLDNQITDRGVLRPIQPQVYLPVLDQLESHGVSFVERVKPAHAIHLQPTGSGIWK
ncbi:Saccharopine dehydrogenase-domain-containing protein [Halteromyces radiatus]|uniref:Saccharopine dehydrogenase-domain-containing protein n=1 Tax=Halteromyces radiatus TaxID=101107 RepID=UPI0022202385|nr:Saccharopine dehydrogenase-domain-containing protein [Halteromyces radiatus]KAI8093702.1 Saccharopine dehydrogenase-domain-containing protein [Halteromyces radiatus]